MELYLYLFLRVRNEWRLRRGRIHLLNRSRIYERVVKLSFRSGLLLSFWGSRFGGGPHRYIAHACRCGTCWSGRMARYFHLSISLHDTILNGPLPFRLANLRSLFKLLSMLLPYKKMRQSILFESLSMPSTILMNSLLITCVLV